MKKILMFMCIFVSLTFITGCGKESENNVLKKLEKKIEKLDSYSLKGELEIINNEDAYLYDVEVSYKQDDNFRVSLKNQSNNHEQIILKNKDGVYVLTPSLNKSFKFQSQWPYNNSQSYLLQTILKDIKNDKDKKFTVTEKGYMYTTKVNYSNNNNLVKQNVYLDKEYNITEVDVLNEKNQVMMKMKIGDINYNNNINDDVFTVKGNMSVVKEEETTSKIEDIVYPMYLPVNTYLTGQDKVDTVSGERVILTFEGDNSFMFIQETIDINDEMTTTLVNGELELLSDSIGVVSDNSVNWYSNNREYYVVSDSLSQEELVNIAKSISVMAVGK